MNGWLFFILLLAGFVLSGAYYYVIQQEKKYNLWTKAEGVYYYTQSQLSKGFSDERIKRDLSKMDWEKDLPPEPFEGLKEKVAGTVQDQGALVLRFALGLMFFYQGLFLKIIGKIPAEIASDHPLQGSFSVIWSNETVILFTGMLQLLLGLLLLIGLWTRIVAALSAIYLTQVTIMVSITGNPATDILLLLSIAMALILMGAGDASIDRYVGIR